MATNTAPQRAAEAIMSGLLGSSSATWLRPGISANRCMALRSTSARRTYSSARAMRISYRTRPSLHHGVKQRRRRGCNVGLPHQALADQIGLHPGAGEAGEVGGCKNAALTDEHAILRHARRQPFAHGEARREGVQV